MITVSRSACVALAVLGFGTAASASPDFQPGTQALEATDAAVEAALAQMALNAKARREAWKAKSFADFRSSVYREPFAGGKFIVSGDVALAGDAELKTFFEAYIQSDPPAGLIVHQVDGRDAVWNEAASRNLRYCVSPRFAARHATVVKELQAAATAWQSVSRVRFVYAAEEDAACSASNAKVDFDVRPIDVNGQYLARAFFPNEPRPARNVLIDESAFALPAGGKLQLAGILRHELGHAIGLRHEHTRPEAGRCFEDDNWRPLTQYDAFSVMHYPQCNGGGDWSLTLTPSDQRGIACLYGPARGYRLDPTSCPAPVPGAAPAEPRAR